MFSILKLVRRGCMSYNLQGIVSVHKTCVVGTVTYFVAALLLRNGAKLIKFGRGSTKL